MDPVIGLACFAILLASWFGGVRYWRGIPAGLVAIAVGSLIAWGGLAFGFSFGGFHRQVVLVDVLGALHAGLPPEDAARLRVELRIDHALLSAGVAERLVAADPDRMDELLQRQNYRIAFWRTAGRPACASMSPTSTT